MGRSQSNTPSLKQDPAEQTSGDAEQIEQGLSLSQRPKRKATNAHAFRYLQTRNPSRMEENDLKRALEASLEECPDFWPEETGSCSSSEQSSATTSTSSSGRSSSNSNNNSSTTNNRRRKHACCHLNHNHTNHNKRQRSSLSQPNHLNLQYSLTATHNCCPMSASVHNRYKPVAKKNIYNEADFFHDGIMEYIEYELGKTLSKKKQLMQKLQ